MNPLCSCSIEPETTINFFALPQLLKHYLIKTLFDKIKLPGETLWLLNNECLLTVLLFGSKIYNEQVNVQILNA